MNNPSAVRKRIEFISEPISVNMADDWFEIATLDHLRRYSLPDLVNLVSAQGFQVRACTYWGLPLLPFLWVRKRHLRFVRSENVIRRGFDPGSKLVNRAMHLLSLAEPIPQKFCGTSAMLLARKIREPGRS